MPTTEAQTAEELVEYTEDWLLTSEAAVELGISQKHASSKLGHSNIRRAMTRVYLPEYDKPQKRRVWWREDVETMPKTQAEPIATTRHEPTIHTKPGGLVGTRNFDTLVKEVFDEVEGADTDRDIWAEVALRAVAFATDPDVGTISERAILNLKIARRWIDELPESRG